MTLILFYVHDIDMCVCTLRTNAQSIGRIVDDRNNGNASLKSEIRLPKDDIKDIQDNLSNNAENCREIGKNNTNLINSSSGKQGEKF